MGLPSMEATDEAQSAPSSTPVNSPDQSQTATLLLILSVLEVLSYAHINGLICVGLVYPSSYPVDSIYKGTPVITSKNIITIMFMIPSNQQVRKRLVR